MSGKYLDPLYSWDAEILLFNYEFLTSKFWFPWILILSNLELRDSLGFNGSFVEEYS